MFYFGPSPKNIRVRGQIVSEEFTAVYDRMASTVIDMRTAAYAHPLNQLGPAVEAHGTGDYLRHEG